MSSQPTVAQVEEMLATPKGLVKHMDWQEKDGNKSPVEYSFFSAVDIETGAILEGVIVRAMCYPTIGVDQDKYNFGIFLHDERVYGVDFAPNSRHKNNKAGYGRPYFGQIIGGCHEHLWDTAGYGYCEPIGDRLVDAGMDAVWSHFCQKATIIRNNDFTPPFTDPDSGQLSWV